MNDETAIAMYQDSQAVSSSSAISQQRMTLDQVITAWLNAKSERTHSAKTQRAYDDTLTQFRAILQAAGLDLDGDPAIVATLAQGFAGQSTNGRPVAPATFNQRCAILSSFYLFAIKRNVLARNPITLVERRPVHHEHAAAPLEATEVEARLQAIDRTSLPGARDYALLALLFLTGRRASELAGLRCGDIRFGRSGNRASITWRRCKGGKVMRDDIEGQTAQALVSYLHKAYGTQLASLEKDAPVWVSVSHHNAGQAITTQAIADVCEQRLGVSKVHVTRHTFAVAMERAGASLSDIGARLGHTDLKTTSEYMKRLHSAENAYADKLETMFGM